MIDFGTPFRLGEVAILSNAQKPAQLRKIKYRFQKKEFRRRIGEHRTSTKRQKYKRALNRSHGAEEYKTELKMHWRNSTADYMKQKKRSVNLKTGQWYSPNQSS